MLSKIILVGVDGSQPAKKALEYAANLASKNESHLYIMHVIEEFGELIQRWEQHDSYVDEVKRLSKDLLHQCESRARELGVTKIDTIEEEGDAAEKILQSARDKEVDTIVSYWKQGFEYCRGIFGGKCIAESKSSCKVLSSCCEIKM